MKYDDSIYVRYVMEESKNKKEDFERTLIEEFGGIFFFSADDYILICEKKKVMHGIFRSRKRRVKSFEFLNPRSSIRGTFIPLQSRAFFSFFFFD